MADEQLKLISELESALISVAEIGDINAMNQIYHELQLVTDNYLGTQTLIKKRIFE